MGLKIVKIADYDNEKERLNYAQAQEACAKKGCRLLTAYEALNFTPEQEKEFYSAIPFWVEGPLARGYGNQKRPERM